MEISRQERARAVELEKFRTLIAQVKAADGESALDERKYIGWSSALHDSGGDSSSSALETLIGSGNALVDKCTHAFASLALEVDFLVQQARHKFFDGLLLYGEYAEQILERDDGVLQMMSNFLPFLYDLSQFITRCSEVARNLFLQLYGFFKLSPSDFPKANERPMTRVWRSLGDLLSVLAVLDQIVLTHPCLNQHWAIFSRSIQIVQHNPSQFDVNPDDTRLGPLQGVIAQLQAQIMTGQIFKNCCQQPFDAQIRGDKPFVDRFQKVINEMLSRWDKLANEDKLDKQRYPKSLLAIMCLAIFYHHLKSADGSQVDRKMIRTLCATHKRIVSFHLLGDLLFTPVEFLLGAIPGADRAVDRKTLTAISQAKSSLLEKQMEVLAKELQQCEMTVAEWEAEMRQWEPVPQLSASTAEEWTAARSTLLLKGAHVADKMTRLMRCILNGHLGENRTIAKSNARLVFQMVELVQTISLTFNHHWPSVLEWASGASMHWNSALLRVLETVRLQLPIQQSSNKYQSDIAASVQNAEYAICQAPTKARLIACGISLEIANYKKSFRSQDSAQIDDLLTRLDSFVCLGQVLARVTDCSFLFWHRMPLSQAYFESLLGSGSQHRPGVQNLKLFLRALDDCSSLFPAATHCAPITLVQFFHQEMFNLLKENFLDKLCIEIENDLRLTFHAQQDISTEELENRLFPSGPSAKAIRSPISKGQDDVGLHSQEDGEHLLALLDLPEFKLGDRIVNVKEYITTRLEETFYNLTVLALHDCEAYSQMRILASFRYGLQLSDSHLPYMSVNQGLDLLTIIRDVHAFVANYSYDLNEQIFIERDGKSRLLNVVRVQQVVNSIKTHGLGILNLSVNSTYQQLKREFHTFSQFLFNDQIKSQLVKEIRFYRDSIDELNQMYPVKRAEAFIGKIKRLGAFTESKSFLDKFRELITRIGNALGFVRMMRSGAVESCACAAEFTPKGDEISRMVEAYENSENQTDRQIAESARVLNAMAKTVQDTFENSNDYIEMLTSVFAKEFRNFEKFAHLRHFFMIIPALTINYVDHIFSCRTRLGKRTTHSDADYTFVDDGFSMGIAYILALLNQSYFFESLNWFDSVFTKFQNELDKIAEEQKEAQKCRDESLMKSFSIKITRLEEMRREFEYLMYTLNSALIFFKGAKENDEEMEEIYLEEY